VDALSEIVRESLIVAAILCFPVLAVATLVGTAIAVLQAATQVQEQTLALLPKMLAVALMVAFFGSYAENACAALLREAIAALPAIVSAP
jgi:flagellar biosynthetic protein FliQ